MDQTTRRPIDISKRIILGIIGISSLLVGLYIGYRLILWISIVYTDLPRLFVGDIYILFPLMIIWIILIWIGLVIIFLKFSHPFLKSARMGTPLDIYLVKSGGSWIVAVIITMAFMWVLPQYAAWDPHLGQVIIKDNFEFRMKDIKATDHIEYSCNDIDTSINGWKFVILHYYIINKWNVPIHILPGSLVDENGVRYSNLDSDCLPKNESIGFDYSKDVPAPSEPNDYESYRLGNLVYKLPINAIPAKVTLTVSDNEYSVITISLHERNFLFF